MKITICKMVEPDVWEPPYLTESFKYLKDLSDDYHLIIARTNNQEEFDEFRKSLIVGKKNILFLLSDELGINNIRNGPYFMHNEIHCIFRTYNNKSLYDNNFVYPVPCGFSCGVSVHSQTGEKSIVRNFDYSDKPLSERDVDIFFSGQMNSHRLECISQMELLSDEFNCLYKKTDSFAKGFALDEYYKYLENSKVAFVPTGVVIPESFRFFEAVKSGCIIVTTYPIKNEKFKNWYYEDCPAYFIDSWSEVNHDFIRNLLNTENPIEYSNKNRNYYNKFISPRAIANYILGVLKTKSE